MSRWLVPDSWEWVQVDDVADVVGGGTPSTRNPDNFAQPGEGIAWLTPADLSDYDGTLIARGRRDLSIAGYQACGAKLMPRGAVLFTSRAPIGYCVVADGEICTNQGFKSLVLRGEIDPRLVRQYLLHSKSYAESLASGSTFMELSGKRMKELEVPIPPLPEQRRIVAKIEELQARSRRAREALEAIPELIEQFRQSVLAAAFRGDLTANWRQQQKREGKQIEPASELLKRILTERRQRWEDAERDKLKAKGLTGPKLNAEFAKRRKKHKEPTPPDTADLADLPEGWCWTNLGQAFEVFVGATPSRKVAEYWGGEINWVSSGEVAWCRIQCTEETITQRGLERTSTRVHPPGTVLVGMIGEGKTRGQAALLDIPACNNQNSAAIRVSLTPLPPELVYNYLLLTYEETRRGSLGNNQPALNKSKVESIPFPLPPEREAATISEIILDLVEPIASAADRGAEIASCLDSLDQSVLAKAFRGELVPQNPSDEPASVLLERIREAREAQAREGKGKRPRKGRKTMDAKSKHDVIAVLRQAERALPPEDVFRLAGFSEEDVDEFYDQLREGVRSGVIAESRPSQTVVLLRATEP